MDKVGQPGWPVIRPHKEQELMPNTGKVSDCRRADYGALLYPFLAPPSADNVATFKYNKSLDPTVLRGTRVATLPVVAATRAPLRPAGQLPRYAE